MTTESIQDNLMVKIFLETSPDMIGILDREGKVLNCNEHYAVSLGYTKDELLGMVGPVDFVSSKDRQKALTAFNEVVKTGKKLGVPLEVVRKDGSTFPSIWSGAALYGIKENLEGYIVTGKDLSEIQKLKNEIQESAKQNQKEKMMMIGQLTSRLAHDIKNPLNVIRMGLEILSKKSEITNEAYLEKVEILKRNVSRISSQVDYVLDFIREKPLEKEKIVLSSCIIESLKNIEIPKNININCTKSDVTIIGDHSQLVVVFTNLIINSIQAIDGNYGTISIHVYQNSGYVIIEIQDSGSGIPESIMSRIFEPLVTTKQEGTGLGLVSCKNIIENHGGIIFAKNNPTTFTIKLPV